MSEKLAPVPEEVAEREYINENEFVSFIITMIEGYLNQIETLEEKAEEYLGIANGMAREVQKLKKTLESVRIRQSMGERVSFFKDGNSYGFKSSPKGKIGFKTE